MSKEGALSEKKYNIGHKIGASTFQVHILVQWIQLVQETQLHWGSPTNQMIIIYQEEGLIVGSGSEPTQSF